MSIGVLGASILRTVVPVFVGAALGWLATLGIAFDPATSEAIVSAVILGLTAVITVVYYVVVRLIEQKFPQIGILLGLKKSPAAYSAAAASPTVTAPPVDDAAFALYSRETYDAAVARNAGKHRAGAE